MPGEKHELPTGVLERIPAAVRSVVADLRRGGGSAWLVGGTVRDLLRGEVPNDWDIATDLVPEEVAKVFPSGDYRDSQLGACRLPHSDEVAAIVVTTLRSEGAYRDHRHPDEVAFVKTPQQDAVRRDFTINAIYLDLSAGTLLDPTGGIDDLAQGVLRAIGDPRVRFHEDALRLLRLLRFSARCGLRIEPDTFAGARARAGLLQHISQERVFEELTRTFTGPGRGRALRAGVDLGFFAEVLPEVPPMDGVEQPPQYHPEGDVLTHVCMVLDEVPADSPILSWSAVLHDVGKPATFERAPDRIRFSGHDTLSAKMADRALRRFKAPRELREAVVEICRDHIKIAGLMAMRPRRREAWMRTPHFAAHLAFHRADCLGSHRDLSLYEAARAAFDALPPLREPLLRGGDVVALGVPKGPMVGEVLRAAEALLDEQPEAVQTRDQALALLRDHVRSRIKTDH